MMSKMLQVHSDFFESDGVSNDEKVTLGIKFTDSRDKAKLCERCPSECRVQANTQVVCWIACRAPAPMIEPLRWAFVT